MKKEEENGKKPEYINYSEEEQLLDLNDWWTYKVA